MESPLPPPHIAKTISSIASLYHQLYYKKG